MVFDKLNKLLPKSMQRTPAMPRVFPLENVFSEGSKLPDTESGSGAMGFTKSTISELIEYEETNNKMDYEVNFQPRRGSNSNSESSDGSKKFEGFGWITGVLIRCVLCIFGATLFMRMSWIAGQSGVLLGLCVIILSCIIVLITAVSMSAIVTNGEIKSGGCYYLVSRSLGPEYGGAIGLIFYIANTINASMNCVGLAEALTQLLLENYDFKLIDGGINDVRIYGLAVCLILQCIIFIGTEFESKTQLLLMFSIITSLLSHIIGTVLPVSTEQSVQGITGYSWRVFMDNMLPDFRPGESFISMFGVYFPAMTGIMGGANMSGDLKDPSQSIPKGTMWAIAATTFTYALCMFTTAATAVRDSDGINPPQFDNNTGHFIPPACYFDHSCPYGLANDFQVMTIEGIWPPLIYVGIFATTLSSASGCLIGAPRVFQALCADKLFPYIYFFAKGHGKSNDPFRAYFLTFFIAAGVICIGDLNVIAIVITNFFLAAFAIVNFACFDATHAKSPGFRPRFRYYNKWLSLAGALFCLVTMFVLSWYQALFTLILFGILYLFIKNNKSHISWGTSTEANRYRKALIGLIKVARQSEHVKTYRPQVLVLTGNPAARQALVDFANCITKGTNLLICGHVIPYQSTVSATSCIRKLNNRFTDWLHEQHVRSFYCGIAQSSLRTGVQTLLQAVGLGKMQPNIILIGYQHSWINLLVRKQLHAYQEYAGVISDAFEANHSICIFRNENQGLDHSSMISSETDNLFLQLPDLMLSDRNSSLNDDLSRGIAPRITRPKARLIRRGSNSHLISKVFSYELGGSTSNIRQHSEAMSSSKIESVKTVEGPHTRYRISFPKGFVDVWWLFDDGGLTILLAYLLTSRPAFLEYSKLRIFTICESNADPEAVKTHTQKMLTKFRIQYAAVFVIVGDDKAIYQETVDEYNAMLADINREDEEPLIPEDLLLECKSKTEKYMRLREYLLEHSSASNFIIITLPIASPKIVMNPIYMLWLELLSRDMPPFLFVRGNQTSVLTFYS